MPTRKNQTPLATMKVRIAQRRWASKRRRNRKRLHAYDAALYKERNRVERFFSRIKHFRRIATRYGKLASTFMGFVTLAAIMFTHTSSGSGSLVE